MVYFYRVYLEVTHNKHNKCKLATLKKTDLEAYFKLSDIMLKHIWYIKYSNANTETKHSL